MPFLWQTYVDNVDPFTKVLHVPTLARTIRELKGSYDSLDGSMRALVLSIAFAAIMSLGDNEVRQSQVVCRCRLKYRASGSREFRYRKTPITRSLQGGHRARP